MQANPGSLNYASYWAGSSPHLAAELFQATTGTRMVHVPYSGGGGATPYRIQRAPGDVLYDEPFPNYHICNITVDGSQLKLEMNKIKTDNDNEKWSKKDSL